MAGSNSVFNASLELKSCRLPMPPSSGSRIHPSRCFCPLPAAPNANNQCWGVQLKHAQNVNPISISSQRLWNLWTLS